MPRQARLDIPGLMHHVMARGIGRKGGQAELPLFFFRIMTGDDENDISTDFTWRMAA